MTVGILVSVTASGRGTRRPDARHETIDHGKSMLRMLDCRSALRAESVESDHFRLGEPSDNRIQSGIFTNGTKCFNERTDPTR